MANDVQGSREQGVEFGQLAEDLENESYPISHEALLDRYGDRELELEDGRTTLREILQNEKEAEYEDAEGVRQSIFSMVGDGAIGRDEYSDRGGSGPKPDSSEEMDSV